MTTEFKNYRENNMNCSVTNNMTMVQVIYQLVHLLRLEESSYLDDLGLE